MKPEFNVRDQSFLQDRAYYNAIPSHVLLLPDGSRRYARAHNMSEEAVYDVAQKLCGELCQLCIQNLGLDTCSIFFLRPSSFDAQRRTDENLLAIFRAITQLASDMLRGRWVDLNTTRIRVITLAGISWMTPPPRVLSSPALQDGWAGLRVAFEQLHKLGDGYKKECLFLINYSGKEEIEALVKGNINSHDCVPPVGLAIRTGEGLRLSDCPLQALFSAHLHLIPKFLPEVSIREFEQVIRQYVPINS